MGLGENLGLGGNTWSQVENGCLGLVPNRHFLKHGTGPKQAFLKTWDWVFFMKISSPKQTLDVGLDTEDKSIFNEDFKL